MSSARPQRLALVLALLASCAHVDREREILGSLEVEGNRTLTAGAIQEKLALEPSPIWPWAEPRYFDDGTLVGDRRRLLRFYRSEGFYDAQVESRVLRDGREVRVVFAVSEGEATIVRSLAVEGLADLPDDHRERVLAEALPLREGARIREADYEAAKAALEQHLRDAGYADARVIGEVAIDPVEKAAHVRLVAEPGPRVRFGRVVITGAAEVPRETILARVREVVPEGRTFSDERLAQVQAALFDLGAFAAVRVSRGPADAESGTVPMIVSLREAPPQSLRLGGGVGMDRERLEVRGIGEYTHRNFLGGLRTFRLENRLGYAFVGERALQLEPAESGPVGSSAADFVQPDLVRRVDGALRLEYEHGLDAAYGFDSVRGRVGFPWRLHRSLVFTPSYHLQFFAIRPFTVGTTDSNGHACVDERGDCVLSFVEERLAWDRRDRAVETTSGWYAALSLQQGGGMLGGRASFQRVLGELRWFLPLPERMVLALKLEGGLLFPGEGEVSPIMARFYAGGGSGMRSFGTRRLSPQKLRSGRALAPEGRVEVDGITRPLEASDTVPVGGDAMVDASAELRLPIWGDLAMGLFVDAGHVAHSVDGLDPLGPDVAVGAGLRYRTPFGPVRLDVGYRLTSRLPRIVAADDTLTDWTVPEPPFAVHFAIGEAF
ncbi:MAG TPA: BamA/TamA family outer membrane protein [Vulgatibacter sp.]|nr:BamA/TamA family outer membrane protein [Vulgatibacter sp.]